MFLELKLIPDSPANVALFLFNTPQLNKRQIGRILADPAKYGSSDDGAPARHAAALLTSAVARNMWTAVVVVPRSFKRT